MQLEYRGDFLVMSTHVLPQQRRLRPSVGGASRSSNHPWNFTVTVCVNADRHRLFHALTVPEYMETWISLPGFESSHNIAVSRMPGSYRIDQYGTQGIESSVTGCDLFCRRSKMLFTWNRSQVEGVPESLVLLRLCGDFARTSLCLSHSGLSSRKEYLWHQDFWEASLGRLRSLF